MDKRVMVHQIFFISFRIFKQFLKTTPYLLHITMNLRSLQTKTALIKNDNTRVNSANS